jgi:hypothetical protein
MKEGKEYLFKNKLSLLVFELIATIITIFLMTVFVVKLYSNPVILLIILILPATLFYFQAYSTYMTYQFIKYDYGKKIIISADRLTLQLTQKEKTITISSFDVDKVELHEQNSLGKFGTYNYLVIYTADHKEILITKFTIPLLLNDRILETFLKQKPRIYLRKNFNCIPQGRFTL